MSSTGPACSLSSDQLRERRQELLPGLFRRADDVSDMPNGLRLRFAAKPGLLAELACIIGAFVWLAGAAMISFGPRGGIVP